MGVMAAAALLIGYVVTVSVSVSAGVAAMTSILPRIYDARVWISVALVALLMLGNLRGIRESGTISWSRRTRTSSSCSGSLPSGLYQVTFGELPTSCRQPRGRPSSRAARRSASS